MLNDGTMTLAMLSSLMHVGADGRDGLSKVLSRGERETLVALFNGRASQWSEESHWALWARGLLTRDGDAFEITETGRVAGAFLSKRADVARKARNARARGRAAALSGLGMRRTANGWE